MEEERFLEALFDGRCALAYFAVAGCECVGVFCRFIIHHISIPMYESVLLC